MVAISLMSKKRFFWLSVTFVWVFISIIFLNVIDKSIEHKERTIDVENSKKIAYKIFYTPFRLTNTRSFVAIGSKSNICNKYIKKGVINLKYEYKEKICTINEYGSFAIDSRFKYNEPIKVILEAKKDIEKCRFNIFVYPGKLNMLLTGIIFYWLPFFLVLINIFLPIMKYFTRIKWR